MNWILVLAGAGLAALPLGWLILHFAKKAAEANERAKQSEAVSQETKRQADSIGSIGTDDDVISRLRSKAANKRERETES